MAGDNDNDDGMDDMDDMDAMDAIDAYIDQASSIQDGQLLLLIFISVIFGLGQGGVPGFATIATALIVATAPTHIDGGLGYAVSLQVPVLAMIDVSAAYLHRSSIDWDTTRLMLPLSFVGMAIGQVLDEYMTDAMGRILVGFILLSILTLKVWKDVLAFISSRRSDNATSSNENNENFVNTSGVAEDDQIDMYHNVESIMNQKQPQSISSCQIYAWACVVGLFGGVATMLANSMGPILNVYLLSVRRLTPVEYIGTRAMFFCILNVGKIPMRFLSGALVWRMIPLACGLGVVSVIGVFCAKPIMLSMKEQTFITMELAVVAFAGVRLMWLGLTM